MSNYQSAEYAIVCNALSRLGSTRLELAMIVFVFGGKSESRQGHSCNFYVGLGPMYPQVVGIETTTLTVGQIGTLCMLSSVRLEEGLSTKASQCSLHSAPIFRLLLKVAVIGAQ